MLFSYTFANPIYFMIAVILLVIGSARRWLSTVEVLLSVSLLLIAYVGRSYEMGMAGGSRFASVAFPIYLVMGHLLTRARPVLTGGLLALSGFWLGVYSALFAGWYRVI
jgi:hypothetical protein